MSAPLSLRAYELCEALMDVLLTHEGCDVNANDGPHQQLVDAVANAMEHHEMTTPIQAGNKGAQHG